MGINVSVQYNGGLLPDIILLTLCDNIVESCRYHEEFLSLQSMFPPKSFDNFPPGGGCSEGLDEFRFFLKGMTNDTMSLDYSSIGYIGPRIISDGCR